MFNFLQAKMYPLIMLKIALKINKLLILSFMSLALGDILVKILLCGISETFLPKFSSRNFMAWYAYFLTMSHNLTQVLRTESKCKLQNKTENVQVR